jgi:chemotaxis protein CheX
MTDPIEASQIQEFMSHYFVDVMKTMVSMKCLCDGPVGKLNRAERVSSSVGYGGEHVSGAVYVHFSQQLADLIARVLLVRQIPNENEVNDAVGEVTNMVGGGFKSWLCDAGIPCALSTPAIIRGASFRTTPSQGTKHICLLFLCEHEPVFVDVHYKFT